MHEYVGAIHIHSTYSDGTGNISDITRAAAEIGLDFLLITDHNTLHAKNDGWEGWREGVMVCIGYEINDNNDLNHYLALGLDKTVENGFAAREYVHQVRQRGGIGFIAHPDEKRERIPEHPAFPWTDWDCDEFDGIEIWNHMSEWMEGLTEENKFHRFIHPLKSIVSPPIDTLARWDELNRTRSVSGLGGVDAHAHKANILGFFDVEVFPYKVMLKSIRTHVLLDEPLRRNDPEHFEDDKWKIYHALRDGCSFVANSYHADPFGFEYYAVTRGKKLRSGSTFLFSPNESIRLHVKSPGDADLHLFRNGEIIQRLFGKELAYRIKEPGAYRVEAWIGNNGWVFSNHIRICDENGIC